MQIKNMFDREISRNIQGVVKVGQDDDKHIKQELEEYVVTDELHKHIGEFFSAYRKGIKGPTDKIGVWISGFFGSGKSHFLKILSYLIENREINGKRAVDYFEDKIQDQSILADLKKASDVTTDVVLFDIDAKSESDAMADKDSIVIVLNKVFNEMQGFCGSIPWIAEIERNMARDGVYGTFRETFKKISETNWEDAREDFYYEEDTIIEALSKSTQMSEEAARNWFDRAEQDYTISIERFASRVKEYIDSKGEDRHVAFLIDEVGQYIGDNSHAMLNLQTIVHELGRQCKGKAWIAVTSQEDIDSVLSVKGNDFSKIQGRFDTKISLSSAYVDEVIKKRILVKNDAGRKTLDEVYTRNNFILQNILTFSDNSAEMKKFTDQEEFIDVYPFIPYQFNLLQKVFTSVRIHGASGKHLAEGERSLLSAFQESAIFFSDEEEGKLVPFSAFYETIEAFLDSSIRSVVIHATKNTNLNTFDVEVLKLLFLIKYVKEIPSNLENVATLLIEHIDLDKLELNKDIERALFHLTKETLIQKNGNEYVFLTNDEQDVNREIKNMQVDTAVIIQKIGEEVFEGIYPGKKYRYSPVYHFSFNGLIDDRPVRTQTHEIGVRVLTPYSDDVMDYNSSELKMMSMRENNVILKLPQDTSYLEEMEEILKIEAYLRVKSGVAVSDAIEDIKTKKAREVTERKERLTTYLKSALSEADVFVKSQQLEINKRDPVERINEGLRLLIKSEYNKLDYMETNVNSAKDLQNLIASSDQLSLGDEGVNKLALDEISHYITRLSDRNQIMTIKSITSFFANKPYGWLELSTTALLIELFKAQQINLQLNTTFLQLDDNNLINYLTKRNHTDRVVVKKRERISQVLLKNVKDLSTEMFEVSALPSDEDGLKEDFKSSLARERERIIHLLANYRNAYYPGETVLKNGKKAIEQLLNVNDTASFYNKAREIRRDLQDYAVDSRDVFNFFENQRDKFDDGMKRITIFKNNRSYVTDKDILVTVDKIERIINHINPYDMIQQLPGLVQTFNEKFLELLETECEPIRKDIERDFQTVQDELEKSDSLKNQFLGTFRAKFHELEERLARVNNLYEAIAMGVESDRLKVKCMEEIQTELENLQQVEARENSGTDTAEVYVKREPKIRKTKTLSKNQVIKGTKSLKTKEDINSFVEQLRKDLLNELDDNTTINLV